MSLYNQQTYTFQEAQNMQISSYGFADQRRGVFGKLQVNGNLCSRITIRRDAYFFSFSMRFLALWIAQTLTTWPATREELLE